MGPGRPWTKPAMAILFGTKVAAISLSLSERVGVRVQSA
jgi:hypothetical protein